MTKERGTLLDKLIAEHGDLAEGEKRASEQPCRGVKFHSPVPLTTRRYDHPSLLSPADVWLCPTCYAKLDMFVRLYEVNPSLLDWDVLREFGNQIRIFGQTITGTR